MAFFLFSQVAYFCTAHHRAFTFNLSLFMKTLHLTIIALLFFAGANAQEIAKTDSAVVSLKNYLSKNVHPPAVAMENHVEGTVVVSFKVDDNKNIAEVRVVKSLSKECDAEVLRVFKGYHRALSLSPAEYTAGVSFVIQNGKSGRKILTINQSPYQNFLFDINVIAHVSN
jgi:TonB family protein